MRKMMLEVRLSKDTIQRDDDVIIHSESFEQFVGGGSYAVSNDEEDIVGFHPNLPDRLSHGALGDFKRITVRPVIVEVP